MKIALLILTLAVRCCGMDRFEALSQIESGDCDACVGRDGEVSRYQITKQEWWRVTSQRISVIYPDGHLKSFGDFSPTNQAEALEIAEDIMAHRESAQFWRYGKMANDVQWYLLWHRPARVNHPTPRERDRAQRFANLCSRKPDFK
jgi:hypothetical protein